MTGEIDLNGSVHPIGGLETKLDGAKKAGVKIALCPTLNGDDLDRILRDDPELVGPDFKVIKVSNIWEIIPYVFPDAPYQFINYTVEEATILPEYLSETEMELDASRIVQSSSDIRWEQHQGPSLTIIEQPTKVKTKVTGLGVGEYLFRCYTNHSDKEEQTHSIRVVIPEKPQAIINSESVWKGSHGWLDAGNSTGDVQKYKWSLISGEECQIEQSGDLRTRVSKLKAGVYIFELEVFDKFFRSDKTRMQISVVDIYQETI